MLSQGKKRTPAKSGKKDNHKTPERSSQRTKGRARTKVRDPLPMKMRALPQSFWQQPNRSSAPGGSACPILPLLMGTAEASKCTPCERELVSVANTDLLFSLFGVLEKAAVSWKLDSPRVSKRGRPRKTSTKGEDDPCLMNSVVESMQPLLQKEPAKEQQVVLLGALAEAVVPLPTLEASNDYSMMLSRLVMKL